MQNADYKAIEINSHEKIKTVTVIYYDDLSMELMHDVKTFPVSANGRVILSNGYRDKKSIVAICEGNVNILNKLGERVEPRSNTVAC